jgi:hypothetical protein
LIDPRGSAVVHLHQDRSARLLPFAVLGSACIVAAGAVAAAIAPAPTEHGVWAVAYLVLVAGAAQIVLGVGQALLAPHPPPKPLTVMQVVGWNVANAAVIVGTLVDATALVDVGGALLVVVLGLLVYGARRGGVPPDSPRRDWLLYVFRAVVAILLVTIPIGLVLARLRST